MRQRSGLSHQFQRLALRYPVLRRITPITTLLTLAWIYVIYQGERTIYNEHIEACDWESWEQWPQGVQPHRLALIADPQLVDPHTYPGRPWPLNSMTESYTDLYMSRNFRLINARLDPDSIVLLGDLFDGGREWSTNEPKKLDWAERSRLVDLGIWLKDPQLPEHPPLQRRSLESFRMERAKHPEKEISRPDHAVSADDQELKRFIQFEEKKWGRWGDKQWKKELRRFSRIFWSPKQLYPVPQRHLYPTFAVPADQNAIENGADNSTRTQYGTAGGKQRLLFASLPGNHDLGFGFGIQWSVRDRFEAHFGETNQVYVLGNHTFVSLDTPSLSAGGQWLKEGGETTPGHLANYSHIYKPAREFVSTLHESSGRRVADHLRSLYPPKHNAGRRPHEVTAIEEATKQVPLIPVKNPPAQLPVVLLTHVPLFRMPDTECGSLRERGKSIPFAFGYQYQNCLTQALSRDIVTKVHGAGEIIRVFSGDDHDYCEHIHKYNIGPYDTEPGAPGVKTTLKHIRETTVKSFSWAMGVRKPGFQLVSMWNPIDQHGDTIGTPLPTLQTHLCLLPDQLAIFIRYATYAILTLVLLFIRALILSLRQNNNPTPTPSSSPLLSFPDSPSQTWDLPKTRRSRAANGSTNRSRSSNDSTGSRQRASSMSTSTDRQQMASLGVQRSLNARTRSMSPGAAAAYQRNNAVADFKPPPGSLVEKAGYHPKVAWLDPGEGESDDDEESRVGSNAGDSGEWDADDGDDKGAKWKAVSSRRRTKGNGERGLLRRVGAEFGASLGVIVAPCAVWYWWLIRNG